MENLTASLDAWDPFFTAELGAAAALVGLVFVGLSLNLTKIIAYPALPTRALIALILLILVLIISSLMLIPGQTAGAVAMEVLAVGVAGWVAVSAMDLHVFRYAELQSRASYIANMVLLQLAALPYVVGGALLVGGNPAGLYFVAGAVIISFAKAVLDAWVLLVEINR